MQVHPHKIARGPRRLLKIREVCAQVGRSESSVWADIARKKFPAPIKVGGSSRWVSDEIDAYIDALIDQRGAA